MRKRARILDGDLVVVGGLKQAGREGIARHDVTVEESGIKQKGRLVGLPFLFLFVSWMQTYFSASRAAFIMVLK